MKNHTIFALIVSCLFSLLACNNTQQQAESKSTFPTSVSKTQSTSPVKFQPSIPLSEIKTISDYSKVKSEAISNYSKNKSEAISNYSKAKSEAIRIYSAFDRDEIKKLREADMATYLKWLDAEKIGDYEAVRKIGEESPFIKAYKLRTGEKYSEFEKKDKIAWEEYERIDKAEWNAYEQFDAMAYKAYESQKAK